MVYHICKILLMLANLTVASTMGSLGRFLMVFPIGILISDKYVEHTLLILF